MMGNWVKEIVKDSDFPGQKLAVGKIVAHPDGRKVKIVGGQFWGTHGVSNFWYWREVLDNGELGELENGYGWEIE
jgi:hypothetical protein